MIPFGEFMPDLPGHAAGAGRAHNVWCGAASYLPFRRLSPVAAALPSAPKGAISVRSGSTSTVYAGSATKLYQIGTTNTDVTRLSGGDYSSGTTDWRFARKGEKVIATNYLDAVQVISISGANFAALGGSPPKAKFIATNENFVFLANIDDAVDGIRTTRVHWSAFDDITSWTPGTGQSDIEDLESDGGPVMSLYGGTIPIALQLHSISRFDYVGPDLGVYSQAEIEKKKGLLAENASAQIGRYIFYLSHEGFNVLVNYSSSEAIGNRKIDRYFFKDVDPSKISEVRCAIAPRFRSVCWLYQSVNSPNQMPDKMVIYNWIENKWSTADAPLSYIMDAQAFGYTLEQMDATFGAIDTWPFPIDSPVYAGGSSLLLSGFDQSYRFGFFDGDIETAYLETTEHGEEENRYVKYIRPYVEGDPNTQIEIALCERRNLTSAENVSVYKAVDSLGRAHFRSNNRFHRAKVKIAGGFEHAKGVQFLGDLAGDR